MKNKAPDVLRNFTAISDQAVNYHKRQMLLIERDRNQSSFEMLLVEQFVLSIAVKWEAFINDLFIAYFTDAPKPFLRKLKVNIRKSNADKFGLFISKKIKFVPPESLTSTMAQEILDPRGWNISASTFEKLSQKANQYLSAKYAKKFMIDSVDSAFLDFITCLRNYLSHGSRRSSSALKLSLSILQKTDGDSELAGHLIPIGKYLRTRLKNGETRAIHIALRIIKIANKLV